MAYYEMVVLRVCTAEGWMDVISSLQIFKKHSPSDQICGTNWKYGAPEKLIMVKKRKEKKSKGLANMRYNSSGSQHNLANYWILLNMFLQAFQGKTLQVSGVLL